jgi:hypothetical protein
MRLPHAAESDEHNTFRAGTCSVSAGRLAVNGRVFAHLTRLGGVAAKVT